MAKDYLDQPYHALRRADRAMADDDQIRLYLHRAAYGALAVVHDGQPFINSNLFAYDEANRAIYIHTAHVGRTQAIFASTDGAPLSVCFSTFSMGRMLPADEALEFSVEYEGVTVFGEGRLVEDEEGMRHALQMLLDKYAPHLRPGRDYRPIVEEELKRTAVFRIDIRQWSGKKKEESPSFPGAYHYPLEP
ncbi:MAG: pyridoxamine 5'-phosphate oxidase family protein [Rhodothermales bacterium]